MKNHYKLLYMDAAREDLERLAGALGREHIPCEVTWVQGLEAFAGALAGGWSFDLVCLGGEPMEAPLAAALLLAKQRCPEAPLLLLCQPTDESLLTAALKAGARDYAFKPGLARLGLVVRRALEEARAATALNKAESERRHAEALLRATLAATQEGVLITDLAGRISSYNRKFMTLCGIPAYVLAPMQLEPVFRFLLEQVADPTAFLAEAQALILQPDRSSCGLLKLKDNRVLEENSRAFQVDQRNLGRVYTFSDATAQTTAPSQEPTLGHGFRQMLEAAGAGGVVPWHLTEDSLLVAAQLTAVLGLGAECLPKDLPELEALIHPEERDRFRLALEQPAGGSFQLRMRHGRDGWHWTRWTLKRHPAAGYHGVFADISEQRKEEEAFAQRSRSQGMAFLAKNSARVLRQLLKGAQEPLRQLEQQQPTGPFTANLASAQNALVRIEALLEQLTTAVHCQPALGPPLEVRTLAQALLAPARVALGPGIRLKLEIAPQLAPVLMGADHLRQVIMNLLVNAAEAMEGSGTIHLRFNQGRPQECCPTCGACILLEVQDHGPGIPTGVQSRMFEPFFSTRPSAQGLGLALVRAIVDGYQGALKVISAPGKGTTIQIQLPTLGGFPAPPA